MAIEEVRGASLPLLIREIPWPPQVLYVRGAPLGDEPKVAVVGTRKASAAGLSLARRFARELAQRGVTIVSGLALGIDAAAHEGALETGGTTIAVLGNGVDRIYPREHERLGERILAHRGTLLSEYPVGAPPLPHQFIARNRIVSGLTLGVVVIEAPEASGALATARFALEQNREVFVVPGPVTHPNYAGSHALIKQGAALVTEAADIVDVLRLEPPTGLFAGSASRSIALDEIEKMVITVLQTAGSPMAVDAIAEACAQPVPAVNSAIAMLVVKGLAREEGGKYSAV